ncbi:MAG: glycoside hydrolase family 95 protein, partial [Bacteroidales bacterium]|nr:glycoside hydrolase family 95 protein [Bacteroidales bacterium]
MIKKTLITLSIATALLFSCSKETQTPDSSTLLWFNHPAQKWEEATPLGNGRIGAMDFGQTTRQVIQLNEESLWAGEPQDQLPVNGRIHMQKFRELILDHQYQKAYDYGMANLTFNPTSFRSYQTLGNLILDFNLPDEIVGYKRILDLSKGLETTVFEINGIKYKKRLLISAVDNLMQLEITVSKKHRLNLVINLEREKDASYYFQDDQSILMDGQIIDIAAPDAYDDNPGGSGSGGEHMRFAARVHVDQKGGTAEAYPAGIHISNANKVVIRLTAATDFNVTKLNFDRSIDPLEITRNIIDAASYKSAKEVLADHVNEHRNLFDQVGIELGETTAPGLCTYDRLARVVNGEADPLLDAQYYQFGRYLLMSSSRAPGRLPANLQGIWNNHMWAPWEADYHQNINLQMNYWPALSGNLEECFQPLVNFMLPTYEHGRTTADSLYGSDGWVAHTAASVFGRTTPSGSTKSSQMINGYGFPLAGAWMSLSLHRYYEYTLDTAFLENTAYPTLKGAAEFIRDYLTEDPSGYLVSVPSSSPENNFIDPESGKSQRLTYGSTIDNEIIREVIESFIAEAEVLDIDADYCSELKNILTKLPPVQIGANGTIMEWIEDYEEAEPGHRHMSHLFALHPSFQITPDGTPVMAEAARKTLERRLKYGGGHTGWSR